MNRSLRTDIVWAVVGLIVAVLIALGIGRLLAMAPWGMEIEAMYYHAIGLPIAALLWVLFAVLHDRHGVFVQHDEHKRRRIWGIPAVKIFIECVVAVVGFMVPLLGPLTIWVGWSTRRTSQGEWLVGNAQSIVTISLGILQTGILIALLVVSITS